MSDVGVLPTHRRRGVLTALMDAQLRDCVERGEPVTVLHASEGSIYRRYGYGAATRWRQVRIDARRVRFRADHRRSDGSLSVAQPGDAGPTCAQVHDRVRRLVPGGLARNDAWWSVVAGGVESYMGGDPRHLVMIHRGHAGVADGYAIYAVREDWTRHQPAHALSVWELVGETLAVELALWRALIEHDLIATVTGPIAVDHGLWDVVDDPRLVGTDWEQDLLWVRILDVARVLSERTYDGTGRLVLRLSDPQGITEGTYALDVDDGTGRCEPAPPGDADLTLDVSELGSLLLGGGSARRLVRAGRVTEHRVGAAALADRLLAVDPLPWCWVRF